MEVNNKEKLIITNNQDNNKINKYDYNKETINYKDEDRDNSNTEGCCSCCKKKKERELTQYIFSWKKYLEKEKFENGDSDPFRFLTNLWTFKTENLNFSNIRLNTNIFSAYRTDLEFYIPQLCCYLIFNNKAEEEYIKFICQAGISCFYFAHRVIMFLQSYDLNLLPSENQIKINELSEMIKSFFYSEFSQQSLQNLFIPNSESYLEYIQMKGLDFIYQNSIQKGNLSLKQTKFLEKSIAITNKIREYDSFILIISEKIKKNPNFLNNNSSIICNNEDDIENIIKDIKEKDISVNPSFIKKFYQYGKVDINDIYVKLFPNLTLGFQIISESSIMIDYEESIKDPNLDVIHERKEEFIENQHIETMNKDNHDNNNQDDLYNKIANKSVTSLCSSINDVNLMAFNSTLNFYESICSLCEKIRHVQSVPIALESLKNELIEINSYLPANVYLPFPKIRNYILAHISIQNTRIFKTKTRAPYMLICELIRIEELSNAYDYEKSKEKIILERNHTQSPTKSKKKKSKLIIKAMVDKIKSSLISSSDSEDISNSSYERSSSMSKSKRMIRNEIKDKLKLCSFLNNKIYENDIKNSQPLYVKKLSKDILRSAKEEAIEEKIQSFTLKNHEVFRKEEENNHKMERSKNLNRNSMEVGRLKSRTFIDNKKPFMDRNNNEENRKYEKDDEINIKNESDFNQIELPDAKKAEKNRKINKILSSRINSILSNNDLYESLCSLFGDNETKLDQNLRETSPFGNFASFKLFKIIVKSGDDLKQEQFATQLINEFNQIFKLEKVEMKLNNYEVLSTGNNVGLIECINDAISIDELHKKTNLSLKEFFDIYYNEEHLFTNISKKDAKMNFIKSFAAYCLVCYFLQIKDRHNQNIMIDRYGNISHIDFGFMLSNAPGKGIQFEKAPFKLTNDIIELMDGVNSNFFEQFRKLLWKGFYSCVKHSSKIIILVEMMLYGHKNSLPCFEKGDMLISELKNRFFPKEKMKASDYLSHVDSLISQSINNWRTKWYDKYQYYFQGIFYINN